MHKQWSYFILQIQTPWATLVGISHRANWNWRVKQQKAIIKGCYPWYQMYSLVLHVSLAFILNRPRNSTPFSFQPDKASGLGGQRTVLAIIRWPRSPQISVHSCQTQKRHFRFFKALRFESVLTFTSAKFVWKRYIIFFLIIKYFLTQSVIKIKNCWSGIFRPDQPNFISHGRNVNIKKSYITS